VREAKVVWPNLAPGRHQLAIEIDPGNQIAEVSDANNTLNIEVLVVTHGVYLPFIRR
jgi:subtilase family serine protease